MNPLDTPFYVVRRKATPNNLRSKDTFMSMGYGWTTNPVFARTFRSMAAARAQLGKRPGEIVTAQSIGLEIKP